MNAANPIHAHGNGDGHGAHGADGHAHPEIGFLKKYVFSVDHKVIGIQFLFMGLMFMVVGGLLAMLIRWQLAWPDPQTQGRDHPVPILAQKLWATTAQLGQIAAVDAAAKTVTLTGVDAGGVRKGDDATIKAAGGEVVAKVASIDGNQMKLTLPAGSPSGSTSPSSSGSASSDASATVKAGDAVTVKRRGPMPPDFYNMVFSMHATIMIFFVIIPLLVGTFGNYLIPLKIGAPDMAFPFLNGLAFWAAVPAAAIMVASFTMRGGAAQAGWTSYPPLSSLIANQAGQEPWNTQAWWGYQRPAAEDRWANVASFLRIGAPVVEPGEAKFANNALTAPLPGNLTPALIEKTTAAARDAIKTYRDRGEGAATGVTATAKADGPGKATLTVTGADEKTARRIFDLTRDKLRWQGTWSDPAILVGFAAMALMCGYICAYFIRFNSTILNVVVGVVLSLAAAFLLNKGAQYVAFDGQAAWFLSITWLGFSSLMGAVNYLTTIVKLRCPGMTMFRLPLSVWSLFITSALVLLATPVLASALVLNLLDHHRLTSFFIPTNWVLSNQTQMTAGGGYPVLHQHLFWFYSHPAVYIMILPAMGMVSDIIAVFSRKPIFGYRPMVYAMAGIAFLGFIVWAHHMFQSGMNPTLGTTFAISTMFIAVPSAIKVFNWLGTLWRGNIQFTTPMLHSLAFVSMFVIGGLSGIFMASTAVDVHIHDTYFIVAHIHYVLFGGSMFGIFAAITFWYPKMFGRTMSEGLGKLHFWVTFVGFNGTFFMMHVLGMRGMPRRVAGYTNYLSFSDLQPMNVFITMCAFLMAVGQIPFVVNFLGSLVWGKRAEQNPWNATTLEWVDAPTPPPHGNFEKVPMVYHGPYEYSSPLVEEDWLAQTRRVESPEGAVVTAQAH
jgi:heme/copper-type cytochrome/quinol oxidase subunit 1